MRRIAAWILIMGLLITTACAESTQKAPDYIMEGCDADVTYRVWETNLFFARMQEKTGVSFQFRQYTDYDNWTKRKKELLEGQDIPDVLFKAELGMADVRDLYEKGILIDLTPYLEEYAPNLLQGEVGIAYRVFKEINREEDGFWFIPEQIGINGAGYHNQAYNRGFVVRWDYYKELGYPPINNEDD